MQAQSLWAGSEYAYIYGRGNQQFSLTAQRVRVIRVFKEKADYWNERLSTFVEVNLIDDDGNVKKRDDGKDIIRKVRARDIVDHWEHYVDERDRRQAELDERKRKQREQEEKINAENLEILDALERAGIHRGGVSFGYGGGAVHISREVMKQWMTSLKSPQA